MFMEVGNVRVLFCFQTIFLIYKKNMNRHYVVGSLFTYSNTKKQLLFVNQRSHIEFGESINVWGCKECWGCLTPLM